MKAFDVIVITSSNTSYAIPAPGDLVQLEYFFNEGKTVYDGDLDRFLQGIPSEQYPSRMHKNLMYLKKWIRCVIAEDSAFDGRKEKLRSLIAAINIRLFQLEQAYPDKIVKLNIEPDSFPDFLANMEVEKAAELTAILSLGPNFNIALLRNLYHPEEQDYVRFQQLLLRHSIEFLGGSNSKNFKLTNHLSGVEWVLKIENRLGVPMDIGILLADNFLEYTLTHNLCESAILPSGCI